MCFPHFQKYFSSIQRVYRNSLPQKCKKQQVFVLCGNVNLNLLGLDHIVYLLALTAWVVKFLKRRESIRAERQPSLLRSPRRCGWPARCRGPVWRAQRPLCWGSREQGSSRIKCFLTDCRNTNEVHKQGIKQVRSEGTTLFSCNVPLTLAVLRACIKTSHDGYLAANSGHR